MTISISLNSLKTKLLGDIFGGESGVVFRPISEITATMEKSFHPFAIADTSEMAAMKFDGG